MSHVASDEDELLRQIASGDMHAVEALYRAARARRCPPWRWR